jgi:hypothetical protein
MIVMLVFARSSPIPQTVQAPALADPGSASLQQVDGGPRYYAKFPRSLPSGPSYFPVGVWFESVLSQADVDRAPRRSRAGCWPMRPTCR